MMFRRLKLKKLIKDLDEAEIYLSQFSGGYSGNYICSTEVHKDFKEELEKLKNGNTESIKLIYGWFLPTCEWDDFTDSSRESLNIAKDYLLSLQQTAPSDINIDMAMRFVNNDMQTYLKLIMKFQSQLDHDLNQMYE